MKRTPVDNTKALDTFLAAKLEIDALLERLKSLRNDHFNADPDQINWGHVGTLDHYRARLREITDSAFITRTSTLRDSRTYLFSRNRTAVVFRGDNIA